MNPWDSQSERLYGTNGKWHSINANSGGGGSGMGSFINGAFIASADCRNGTINADKTHTLQAKPNGGRSMNCLPILIFDARGNGNGDISPTLTGDHQNRITDYTALIVDGGMPLAKPLSECGDAILPDSHQKVYAISENVRCEVNMSEVGYYLSCGGGKVGQSYPVVVYSTAFWESGFAEWKDAEDMASIRASGGSCGGGQ